MKVYIFKNCEFDRIIYCTVTEDGACSAVLSPTLLLDLALQREQQFLHSDTRRTTLHTIQFSVKNCLCVCVHVVCVCVCVVCVRMHARPIVAVAEDKLILE